MTNFYITWRSSGGRGEYEYSPIDPSFEGKDIKLAVHVGSVETVIETDSYLEKNGGKRRVRRKNPTDRVRLSVPNLAIAIAGIPKPTRDRENAAIAELRAGCWALGQAHFEILSKPSDLYLILRPLSIKPRHFSAAIEVEQRLLNLQSQSLTIDDFGTKAKEHLSLLMSGVNDVTLEKSALNVYSSYVSQNSDIPLLASKVQVEVAHTLISGDGYELPAITGNEGKKRVVAHALRERDKKIIEEKKKAFKKLSGRIYCECCEFSPKDMYGYELEGLIEVHHKVPLSECADDEVRVTTLDDLVLLCRNCHGAIHRITPMPPLEDLRLLLRMRLTVA
jgi:hypothetical protein